MLEVVLKEAIPDPDFLAWAKKVGRGPIAYLDGKHSAESIRNLINTYKKYADKL